MKPIELTAEQKKEIERRRKGTPDRRVYQRLTAVLAVGAGKTREEVAELLGVGLTQLSEWLRIYRNQGLDALCEIHNKGDPGNCMYVVQSGVIEMIIGEKVIEVCGENEAIGFMSMVDRAPRSSTARVKEACELSIIDQRKFRFMVDEVPNFALYIMGAMARRIRGMGQAM